MIEALTTGKLHQRAESRTSKTGKTFVTAKIRTAGGGDDSLFVNAVTFSETAGAALLALHPGDGLAVAGTLKPGVWTDREGTARPSLDIVVSQVMTAYGLTKKRRAIAPEADQQPRQGRQQRRPEADDMGPQDWPEEAR